MLFFGFYCFQLFLWFQLVAAAKMIAWLGMLALAATNHSTHQVAALTVARLAIDGCSGGQCVGNRADVQRQSGVGAIDARGMSVAAAAAHRVLSQVVERQALVLCWVVDHILQCV